MRDILDNVFSITLITFISLGVILVGLQIIAVITTNGSLAISAKAYLAKPAFILSYLHGWKSGD